MRLHCFIPFFSIDLQREELRARFPGVPGDLVNFFLYVAEEVNLSHLNFIIHVLTGLVLKFLICSFFLFLNYFFSGKRYVSTVGI